MSQPLSARYAIRPRFQRSARIETDFGQPTALDGLVVHTSAWNVLHRMATHLRNSSDRAFTWTGPYGSGKSTLALWLSSFLDSAAKSRSGAERLLGNERCRELRTLLPVSKKGWVLVHVVGRRTDPAPVIAEALDRATKARWPRKRSAMPGYFPAGRDPKALVDDLLQAGAKAAEDGDGLLVVVDELGKFLEHAADTSGDLHLFQEMAEAFARADSDCILLGILHQAFQEYAAALGQFGRDEWAKIQGRFVDLSFSVSLDEVVELAAASIEGPPPSKKTFGLCRQVADSLNGNRLASQERLAERLADCWPLHPVTALLLGPISRRRFGQNERSVFSLLASGEPGGFREFLDTTDIDSGAAFTPDRLWDYLQLNLESAILASPDGHKWAEAAEAVQRAFTAVGPTHAAVAKTIALLDVFGRPHFLKATREMLNHAFTNGWTEPKLEAVLRDLEAQSVAVYRSHLGAWGVYAGSDIDIEAAVAKAKGELDPSSPELLKLLPAQAPIVAKRTYHRTGTLRWFGTEIRFSHHLESVWESFDHNRSETGRFVLVLPTRGDAVKEVREQCAFAAEQAKAHGVPIAFGISGNYRQIADLALELAALNKLRRELPALEGDAIARRELYGRMSAAQSALATAAKEGFVSAEWYLWGRRHKASGEEGLTRLASQVADEVYGSAPILRNELINRDKPSSNAVAAQRALMKRMAEAGSDERLGIEGYPPELGLYVSILKSSRLHRPDAHEELLWRFAPPSKSGLGASFVELWKAANALVDAHPEQPLPIDGLYEHWRQPPFGLRYGVMPILALAFILAQEEELAVYIDGVFTPQTDDYFVDRLLQRASEVAIRRFRVVGVRRTALQRLAGFVAGTFDQPELTTALQVAKPLVRFVHELHPWVKRTLRLAGETIAVRDVILNANDPYALLFEHLPAACGMSAKLEEQADGAVVRELLEKLERAVSELRSAYPLMLDRLKAVLLKNLAHSDFSEIGQEVLKQRAERVIGMSGDFRLDAFARRIKGMHGDVNRLEGLCSLAANKPPRDWTDPDLDKAAVELSDLASRFKRIEQYAATIQKAPDALTVSMAIGEGQNMREFAQAYVLSEEERQAVARVVLELKGALSSLTSDRKLQAAAILKLANDILLKDDREDIRPLGRATEGRKQ